MKAATIAGFTLIVLGILAVGYEGVTMTPMEQQVVDLGLSRASMEREGILPVLPVVGAVAVVSGIILILVGSRHRQARFRQSTRAAKEYSGWWP